MKMVGALWQEHARIKPLGVVLKVPDAVVLLIADPVEFIRQFE